MRDFRLVMKVSIARLFMCMAVAWAIYNPWLSLVTWLQPQFADTDKLSHLLPLKLFAIVVVAGFVLALALTVRNSLGVFWSLVIVLATSLLAYFPFSVGWITETWENAGYAVYYFVLPTLLAAGLSAGFWVRYWKGTLFTQPVGGHGETHINDVAVHHQSS